jgi:predicted tellurium resistance membrane protein TerC
MEWINSPEAWIALLTLSVLEIVLGIDNIIFVAILAERVKAESRARARRVGLGIAIGTRIALLFSIVWIMRLTAPLFTVLDHEVSGRDLILITGGVFLLFKSTRELHHKLEGDAGSRSAAAGASTFASVIVQIALLDVVFSLDSVITAVGVADHLPVMVLAILISGFFMIVSADGLSHFVGRHPTIKVLALSFLLLIGMSLVADGMGQHIPKGYIYFAMGFSVFVEMINLRAGSGREPVSLRGPRMEDREGGEGGPGTTGGTASLAETAP